MMLHSSPLLAALGLLLAAAPAQPPRDLVAEGIVLSGPLGRSVAVLRSDGKRRTVAVGETAFGGRVVSIAPWVVTVEYGTAHVPVRLVSAGAPDAAHRLAEPPKLSLPRAEVQRRLALEVPRILAETTLLPYLSQGQVAGLALARMPQGSLLSDAGLEVGDVITSINDVPVDSLATLASLYPRLQSESVITATVLRDGRPIPITVSLR